MSYQYYILLYTSIYDYCTVPSRGGITFNQKGGASLQGADLYKKLNMYLTEHCKQMREVSLLVSTRTDIIGGREAQRLGSSQVLRPTVG